MTQTSRLQVGRITSTPGARTHLAIAGRTPCGSAGSAAISHPASTYRGIDLDNLCRRCFTPANLTRAQTEATAGGRFNAALDDFLCAVRRIVGYGPQATTPAPSIPAQRPALVAVLAKRPARPLSAWGQIATTFAKTHSSTARAAA